MTLSTTSTSVFKGALTDKLTKSGHNIVILLISLLLFCLEPHSSTLLSYDRALINEGQWWRLFTSNLVHLGFAHAALNIGGLALIVLIFCQEQRWLTDSLVFIGLCFMVGLGIHLGSEHIGRYVGLSGVLHGYFAWYCSQGIKQTPILCIVAWLGISAKVFYEHSSWYDGTPTEQLIGGIVATDAHLYGLIGGSVIGLCFLGWRYICAKSAAKKRPL